MFVIGKALRFAPRLINLNDGRSYMAQSKQNKHCRTLALFQNLACHFHSLMEHETMFGDRKMRLLDSLPNHLGMLIFQAD